MSLTFDPIVAWPWIAIAAIVIVWLTLWAYRQRLRGTTGGWRWLALALRLAAILLCVLAALRPSVLFQKKVKQTTTIVFLADTSRSMTVKDMAGGESRWQSMNKAIADARAVAKTLGKDLDAQFYQFGKTVRELKEEESGDSKVEPKDSETALGDAFEEVLKRQATANKVLSVVVMSDGASNSGRPPLMVAQRMRSREIPVVAVGYGQETASANSRDIAIRDMVAGPTVFVKNELCAAGTLSVRGFPGKKLNVELLAEGKADPVDRKQVTVPEGGATEIPVRDLKWIPQDAGEQKLTLRVKPEEGELVPTNNDYSTFVSVLKGGLNVLYLKGPNFSWEPKYLTRALDASEKIELTFKELTEPAGQELDTEFAPGAYDVYILGELSVDFLSKRQHQLLARAVREGAGLMMLGGRASFGPGGWASTEIADILPVKMHPGDAQNEPKDGLKVLPNTLGLENFVLRLSSNRGENLRIWKDLPAIPGANRFSGVKEGALDILALTPNGEPLMISQNVPKGRVLAFGGETWVWTRFSEESRLAHLRFWRQAILWLARKEDDSDNQVKLALDHRRVAMGGKLELTASARDSKGDVIPGVKYEATVTKDDRAVQPENVVMYDQGNEARGSHFATTGAGDFKVTVKAMRQGETVGEATARFLVYQDDREMENPAADLSLLKQVAQTTGGKMLPPEQLGAYLKSLDKQIVEDYVTQREVRVWDNWPFLLIFTTLLMLEWFLRKRHGWV